jgi:hypothetical protein
MTDPEATTDEMRAVQRRIRLVVILFVVAGLCGLIGGFFIGPNVTRLEPRLIMGGLMAPALAAALWLQFARRLPAGKARMIAGERWDEKTLWIWPFIGLMCVVVAVVDIASPRFSFTIVCLPLLVLSHILGRYLRDGDDFGRATAARALVVGTVAATLSLCALVAVAALAPDWLLRLTSMALAAPMAIAATTYAVLMRRAYRQE